MTHGQPCGDPSVAHRGVGSQEDGELGLAPVALLQARQFRQARRQSECLGSHGNIFSSFRLILTTAGFSLPCRMSRLRERLCPIPSRAASHSLLYYFSVPLYERGGGVRRGGEFRDHVPVVVEPAAAGLEERTLRRAVFPDMPRDPAALPVIREDKLRVEVAGGQGGIGCGFHPCALPIHLVGEINTFSIQNRIGPEILLFMATSSQTCHD
jgi:hypothetical protein